MHAQQRNFCEGVKNKFPQYFTNVDVIDFGSLDINGNNRYLFSDCNYTGVDIGNGPNVDVVSRAKDYTPDHKVDTVISTEMLEHDEEWKNSLLNMINVVKSGGLIVFTCATTGRAEHGTTRCDPGSAPFTNNYYRNITKEDVISVWDMSIFKDCFLHQEGTDLQFWGILK